MSSTARIAPAALKTSALVLVALAAIVPYLLLPPQPFIIDAPRAITANKAVMEGPLSGLWSVDFWGVPANADFATGSYRPLVSLTYALQVRVFGPEARLFHLTDMALHALAAVLLALLIFELIPGTRWAVAGAALFAVHPVLSEAVCSSVGRADLIAGAALLGALLLHLRASHSSAPWVHEAGCLALVAVALLSKEYAVAFPFVIVGVDLARGIAAGTPFAAMRRERVVGVLVLVVLGAYLVLRQAMMGHLGGVPMVGPGDQPLYGQPLGVRWGTGLSLILVSARLLVAPYNLNYFYGNGTLPIATGLFDFRALGAVLLVGLAAFAAWRVLTRRRDPLPTIALMLGLLPLLPALNIVSLAGVLFAERFLYLPVAALMLWVAWLLERHAAGPAARRIAVAAVVVVAIIFGSATLVRAGKWGDTEKLCRASLAWYPRSENALYELGLLLGGQGRHAEAAENFEKALKIEQRRPQVWKNYASALGNLGRWPDAEKAYRRAIELSPPDIGVLWRGLGTAQLEQGHLEEADRALSRAHDLMPDDPKTLTALSRLLLRSAQKRIQAGDFGGAVELAQRAAALKGIPAEALLLAGEVLYHAGQPAEARKLFDAALQQDKDLLRKKHKIAADYDQQGKHAQAAEMFREILIAQPDNVPAMFNLGRSLLLDDRPQEAVIYLQQGLARSNDPNAATLLAEARRRIASPRAPSNSAASPSGGTPR